MRRYKQNFKNDKNDEFLLTLWNLLELWIPLWFLAVFSKLLKIIRLALIDGMDKVFFKSDSEWIYDIFGVDSANRKKPAY